MRAISIVVTGNNPKQQLAGERVRYATADGGLTDLVDHTPNSLVNQISEDWFDHFKWNGVTGNISPEELLKLKGMVMAAHRQKKRLRFWGGPNSEKFWKVEYDAGVDLIGMDYLERGQKFLLERLKDDLDF